MVVANPSLLLVVVDVTVVIVTEIIIVDVLVEVVESSPSVVLA